MREVIKRLTTGTHILPICETWLKASDVEWVSKYTKLASMEPAIKSWRGFGGLEIIARPGINY